MAPVMKAHQFVGQKAFIKKVGRANQGVRLRPTVVISVQLRVAVRKKMKGHVGQKSHENECGIYSGIRFFLGVGHMETFTMRPSLVEEGQRF